MGGLGLRGLDGVYWGLEGFVLDRGSWGLLRWFVKFCRTL